MATSVSKKAQASRVQKFVSCKIDDGERKNFKPPLKILD